MDTYPCSSCSENCENDTILCSSCNMWTHRQCVPMSKDTLKKWSTRDMTFLCRRCCFDGDKYSAQRALERLTASLQSKRRNDLLNTARSELLLLECYEVTLPENAGVIHTLRSDPVSVEILKKFHPATLLDYRPVSVIGDGNCLYRAVSVAITGSEHFHFHLRLLTALELVINKQYYLPESTERCPLFEDTRVVVSDHDKLVYDAVNVGCYSELIHMYALSSGAQVTLRSYYPPQVESEYTSEAFSRRVVGRGVTDACPGITVMWTETRVSKNARQYVPNHFVPLVNVHDDDDVFIDLLSNESVDTVTASRTDVTIDSDANDLSDSVPDIDRDTGCDNDPDPDHLTPDQVDDGNDDSDMTRHDVLTDTDKDTHGKLGSGNFMPTGKVIDILKSDVAGLEQIPGGRKENVFFVLNNESNVQKRGQSGKSSFADDCGVWDTQKGTSPKTHYQLLGNGELKLIVLRKGLYCRERQVKGKKEYIPIEPQPTATEVVILHRYYTNLKADKTYKKRVSWLGGGGLNSSLAVVEYVGKFPGLISHGNNTDRETEYLRTPAHIMDEIGDRLKTDKPIQVFNYVKDKYDELSDLNIQQVRDKKKNDRPKTDGASHRKNIADHFAQLDNLIAEDHPFVRETVRRYRHTPCVYLYTDEQISDLKTLCCTGRAVLGIDKTFNLCDMHVTVTCFKQMSVTRQRTGEPPIFLGPILLHDNSEAVTYSRFLHELRFELGDCDFTKLTIGSDDEKALVNAITTNFRESTHVLCTRHLRQNALHKLTDDAVSKTDRNAILDRIFGDGGVIDAEDTVTFDAMFDSLIDFCDGISQPFTNYLRKKRDTLLTKVTEPTREQDLDRRWTNNNCESINHVLKQLTDWKSKPLTDLVTALHRHVDGQYKDLRAAMIGSGEFRLAPTHQQFKVTKTDWISMTVSQRDKLYRRFRKYVPTVGRIVTSTDEQTKVTRPRTLGKKPCQRKRKVNERTRTQTNKRTKTD